MLDGEARDDFLKWEYATSGRSPDIWAAATTPLLRVADLSWERSLNARDLWREGFHLNSDGCPVPTGRRLSNAEVELLQDMEIDRTALFLLGCAIEGLAKTILVQRNPDLVSDSGRFAESIKHHRLEELVRECDITVSIELSEALNILEDYLWLGRYPIPARFERVHIPGAWVWNRATPTRETWRMCRELADVLTRLRDEGR